MKEEKTKLVIEDNAVYEIDLECLRKKEEKKRKKDSKTHTTNRRNTDLKQEK